MFLKISALFFFKHQSIHFPSLRGWTLGSGQWVRTDRFMCTLYEKCNLNNPVMLYSLLSANNLINVTGKLDKLERVEADD